MGKKFFTKKFVDNFNEMRRGKTAAQLGKAGARKVVNDSKIGVIKAKADLAVARGATKRSIARSSAAASAIGAMAKARSDAAKYSMENARTAISQWNALINQKAPAAEGTGEAKGPDTTGNADVYPTGN